jgi:hypothetical protein
VGRGRGKRREWLVRWSGMSSDHDQWRGVNDINFGGENSLWKEYEIGRRTRDPEDVHPTDGQLQVLHTSFAKALHRYQQDQQKVFRLTADGKVVAKGQPQKLRVLELFSGSGSVGWTIQSLYPGVEVVSLDAHSQQATHRCRIEDWIRSGDGTMYDYPPQYFDIVWASPPCTEYSRAKTCGTRDLETADRCVEAVFQVLDYLKPKLFFIENPEGLLATRPIMRAWNCLQRQVSYCRYGMPYRKDTHIWTNVYLKRPLKMCRRETPCDAQRQHGHHLVTAQAGPTHAGTPGSGSAAAVWPVPYKLIQVLMKAAMESME